MLLAATKGQSFTTSPNRRSIDFDILLRSCTHIFGVVTFSTPILP